MAKQVNIYETKTNLSKLISRVAEGEDVIIAKAGKPVARLVPIITRAKKRKPGLFKDKIKYAQDIDKPLDEREIGEFYK